MRHYVERHIIHIGFLLVDQMLGVGDVTCGFLSDRDAAALDSVTCLVRRAGMTFVLTLQSLGQHSGAPSRPARNSAKAEPVPKWSGVFIVFMPHTHVNFSVRLRLRFNQTDSFALSRAVGGNITGILGSSSMLTRRSP
jgi:hypothetical protein